MGCFVYIILGSSKDVPMGPTAIASLLTFQAAGGVWQRAVLLSFLTGAIELIMGALGLGFLINFVSGPVSSGFTSAVALIILTSQVKDVFGEYAPKSRSWATLSNFDFLFYNRRQSERYDICRALVVNLFQHTRSAMDRHLYGYIVHCSPAFDAGEFQSNITNVQRNNY